MFELMFFLCILTLATFNTVSNNYDIRKYYDKPYCESVKVLNQKVKKCYKLVEVKE